MSKRLLLLLLSLTLVTGCGFKLRGNFAISEALNQVAIEGGQRSLVEQLTDILQDSGSTVVASGESIPVIVITRSEYEQELHSTDTEGLATGFDYVYYVDFKVHGSEGEILLEPASITQRRNLDYEAGNELEVEEEEEFLKEEMEKEIVLQIMRRLARI